jgi:hypothetical protein
MLWEWLKEQIPKTSTKNRGLRAEFFIMQKNNFLFLLRINLTNQTSYLEWL